ncbi:MAG TPA: hypothetical protein VFN75_10605 [Pseudonocardiaceae bacterium]|nr:hypothetical protein [Pseudonocardiaceae bacterium]
MFLTLTAQEQAAVADVWPHSGIADPFTPAHVIEPGSGYVENTKGLWVPPVKGGWIDNPWSKMPMMPCHVLPEPATVQISADTSKLSAVFKSFAEAVTHATEQIKSLSDAPTVVDELTQLFPALTDNATVCPAVGACGPYRLDHVIQHLNDQHRWARERIADWLDTLDIDLTMQPAAAGH